jgi:hypothetical protein
MLPDYTCCIKETSPMRSYRDCVLEKTADRSFETSSTTSSLDLADWDKLSEMESDAGGQLEWDSTADAAAILLGLDKARDWEERREVDMKLASSCRPVAFEDKDETGILNGENCKPDDARKQRKLGSLLQLSCASSHNPAKDEPFGFLACIDSISRFRRPRLSPTKADRRQAPKVPVGATKARHQVLLCRAAAARGRTTLP